MLAKIYFCVTLFSFLSVVVNSNDNATTKRITVVGIALDVKIGAMVQTDNGNYMVDGLHRWEEKYYNKKVRVTGRLVVKILEPKSEYPGHLQELTGKLSVLKNAKWSLAE